MATLAAKLLLCEGGPGSTDAILVRAAIANPSVTVRPVGSKSALVWFVEDPMMPPGCSRMAIRDPDFDLLAAEQNHGLRGAHPTLPIYAWGRLEIENYLLDPSVLKAAYDAVRASEARALPQLSEADLAGCLADAAREIVSYQAARWTLGQLQAATGPLSLHRDWAEPFRLPAARSRDDCWNAVVAELERFVQSASRADNLHAERLFQDLHTRFETPEFLAGAQHLIWFSGRDLLASLVDRLHLPVGMARIIARHARDALLAIGPANSHSDFRELAGLAAQL